VGHRPHRRPGSNGPRRLLRPPGVARKSPREWNGSLRLRERKSRLRPRRQRARRGRRRTTPRGPGRASGNRVASCMNGNVGRPFRAVFSGGRPIPGARRDNLRPVEARTGTVRVLRPRKDGPEGTSYKSVLQCSGKATDGAIATARFRFSQIQNRASALPN
jgi:hypothetical protein